MYLCTWLSWELSDNPTQQPKMLTHLVIVPTPCFGVPLLTDRFKVPLLTDHITLSFASSLTGFCGHSSLCGLRANIDKERSSGHSGAASKMLEMRSPSLATHPQTERETHIHIYIHTLMLIIRPHPTKLVFISLPYILIQYFFSVQGLGLTSSLSYGVLAGDLNSGFYIS